MRAVNLIVVLLVLRNVNTSTEKVEYCMTPGCVKAAASLLSNMDTTVDPCKDFYQFACGTFMKETVIPDYRSNQGVYTLVSDKLNERLRRIFESQPLAQEPKIYQSVRNLYKSCMNEDDIGANGLKDAKQLVTALGGWPLLEGSKWLPGANFSWQNIAERAFELGLTSDRILNVAIGIDFMDSTKRIIHLDQPQFGLDREYLVMGREAKEVKAYFAYMMSMALYFGAADRQLVEKELDEILDFEQKLAAMTQPREERRNLSGLYNPIQLSDVVGFWPGVDWVAHVNGILGRNSGVQVDGREMVNVGTPSYMLRAAAFLPTIPARIQANYLIWSYIMGMAPFLDHKALEITLPYRKVLSGMSQQPPRWMTCVESTAGFDDLDLYSLEGSLTNAVGAMYAKRYFPLHRKKVADEIVEHIRKEFKQMLDELDWMDKETKVKAHEKVDKMSSHMAYAPEILNDKLIEEFYKGLELNSNSYLTNFLNLMKFISQYYTRNLHIPTEKNSWKTHGGAAIVNAFYNQQENSVEFPAGILEGTFFQADWPRYMNYGAIGMTVGHEITHGFDDQGSQMDGKGNLMDWWQKSSKKKYLEKAKCIIDQYSNYTVDVEGAALHVDGINTQGENIADNGAAKEAFRAYSRLVERTGAEKRLPGLEYTQRQLFWISSANIWCDVMKPAELKNQILTDSHSPRRFRVNGPLSNMVEFAADWNCPLGSPMNPAKKCHVW